ncbi:MAG: hypothetical protein RL660_2455 [Bacteroidota bacterium]|jgi:2-polyprenyl-3-methyl-5-hydroxy-6-metoxy-1,4-benzoquinol methylase
MTFKDKLKFSLITDHPVAYESQDHLNPWGTAQNNSTNPRFNEKIYKLFADVIKPLKVLDLGCSGGGFVRNCTDDGCIAIGIEGSDYSQKLGRAEWNVIPNKLFTGDITKPFMVMMDDGSSSRPLKFDLITCWEVMEHIEEADIDGIISNVKNSLLPGGLWIMSISTIDDIVNGVNLHRTVKPIQWWIDKFGAVGLVHCSNLLPFFKQQYIRSNRYNAPKSVHLILTNDVTAAPKMPHYPVSAKLYDHWRGSKMHKLVNMFSKI